MLPDLVLMDIRIKGSRDGVETARLVYERWKTPVILLTAYSDEETIDRAKITQPFGYILKPFEGRELRTAIEIALYRALMERKLRESESRYKRLFQDGPSGNLLTDEKWFIIEANSAFKRLFGLGDEDAIPSLAELFPDASSWESFKADLLASGKLQLAELSLRGRDHGEIVVFANFALVYDVLGSLVGIQGELIDVTERRRLEERLVQSQKMEAIGRLSGGIAHDFNNILTAIIGYSNLLADELPQSPEVVEDIEGIKKAATKAASLTRQLLAFSRRQPISPQKLDLNALVLDTEKMLRRLVSEKVSFQLELGKSLPSVYADGTQLTQILINLVVNARDAMPEGGVVRLSTRVESLSEPRSVGLETLPAGSYALFSVGDSGCGIAPEILDRIFEPFFTTKAIGKGTGLGLATVYGIAKQAGGAIEVASKVGEGARFTVWLPSWTGDETKNRDSFAQVAPEKKI
jgi:two-component system, cell cycle sensor histidine kinase and response regulator CckA